MIVEHEKLKCPVCGAGFRSTTACPRCGADLATMMLLAEKARLIRCDARLELLAGNLDKALALTSQSMKIHAVKSSADLHKLICSLISLRNSAGTDSSGEWMSNSSI